MNSKDIDFSSQSAENYEQKCLCVLVLDVSGSMNEIVDATDVVETGKTIEMDGKTYNVVEGGVSKLDKLKKGLDDFYDDIKNNETTCQRLEISVITFNDYVNVLQEPSLISNCEVPELVAEGNTALVDAVNDAIEIVQKRKAWYKETCQPYYRPWIILMTDGEPNEGQDISVLANRIKRETEDKRYQFLPIGVDNANMDILRSIQGKGIPAMKLEGTKFNNFFKWLSASMGTIINADNGDKVDLSPGASDWMDAFTI